MMFLLGFLKAIIGPTVTTLSREIAGVKKAEIAAQTSDKKLQLEEHLAILEAQKHELVNAAMVQKSMQDNWEIRFLIFVVAGACIAHMVMVVLDSMFLYNWNVAKLPAPYEEYQGKIILSFFGLSAARTIVKGFLGRMK